MKILFTVKDFKTLPIVFIAIMLLIKDIIIEIKVESYFFALKDFLSIIVCFPSLGCECLDSFIFVGSGH